MGENFTLENIREDEICAGDILRVGGAAFQVSGPRTPCANQARRVGRTDWVKLVIRENRTGFYMRVLEAGDVQPGDAWVLMERPNLEGQITALNRCMYLEFDADYALRIQEMKGLGDSWGEPGDGKDGEAVRPLDCYDEGLKSPPPNLPQNRRDFGGGGGGPNGISNEVRKLK